MLEQRIQQHFIDSADLKYQSAESLSKPLNAAADIGWRVAIRLAPWVERRE